MARKYQEILDKLTLKEKASLISGKDFWQTVNIDRVGIPSAFLSDGPHGVRRQAAASKDANILSFINSSVISRRRQILHIC